MTGFQYRIIGLGLVTVGLAGCVFGGVFHAHAATVIGCISAAVGLVIVL